MVPKGIILIIGGGEDKGQAEGPDIEGQNKMFENYEILKDLIDSEEGKRIEVITTATEQPEETNRTYKNAFKKIGFNNVGFLNIQDKNQAREKRFADRVEKSHAVFFSGGDQFRISTILGGTELVNIIKEKYLHEKNFVVAGTSAGAMVLPKVMIYEGKVKEAILKEDLKISSGIGIFDTMIIDTHFISRGRFSRLAHAVLMNPETLGVGLGVDTALIIKKGNEATCHGSGMVVIIDGNHITLSNIIEAEDDTPLYVENLKVHILAKGSKYMITERKMLPVKTEKSLKQNN